MLYARDTLFFMVHRYTPGGGGGNFGSKVMGDLARR